MALRKKIISIIAIAALIMTTISAYAEEPLQDQDLINFATEKIDTLFGDMNLSEEQREQMIAYAYEKYTAPTTSSIQNAVLSIEEPNLYDIHAGRIESIVNLINELGGSADSDSREYNLEFLKENYQTISEMPDIDIALVDWYIEETTYALVSIDFPTTSIKPATRAANYNGVSAKIYANAYWSSYNSSYPDWSVSYGGDCANFVSQCVHFGGKLYNVAEVNADSDAAELWSNWYSYGNTCNTAKVSSTHRGANAFKTYWQSKVTYHTFYAVDDNSFDYGFIGDAISLLYSNGDAYHTLLIVGYDAANNDFLISSHTSNQEAKPLSEITGLSNGYIIFSMYP